MMNESQIPYLVLKPEAVEALNGLLRRLDWCDAAVFPTVCEIKAFLKRDDVVEYLEATRPVFPGGGCEDVSD